MTAYYNEIDPYCAAWLRNLISVNLIAPGIVDERDIRDIPPADLAGYSQHHFFAGIGGWSRALRLAGWPDDRAVWTGSCPCQPFSVAGKAGGFDDERHLWPDWYHLISICRPSSILGEQVANAAEWLRLVRGDLEAVGYAVGAIPIEAASAGADQLRDRYWIVADHDFQRESNNSIQRSWQQCGASIGSQNNFSNMASSSSTRLEKSESLASNVGAQFSPTKRNGTRVLAGIAQHGWGEGWTEDEIQQWSGGTITVARIGDKQVIACPDGKWRPLPPPRVRWLGNGIPARVAKLRAFGNAIVPQVAAEFIAAVMEA